jgi:hypothetical protein
MKKNRGDEPIGTITRKLSRYLPLTQTSKNVIFFFFLCSSTKLENGGSRTGPARGEDWHQWGQGVRG